MSRLKSALISSTLALAAQTTLANKPLPCPTTSPLVDTIGAVQGATKQKVENRLRAIDAEKKHQVVVFTVNSLQEYGYGSIEEMANALGMQCRVGYKGEDTGVVVLYTKTPSRYRIETAATERYVTDAQSDRILSHSKSEEVCQKEDVSCRLDDITRAIDAIIRKNFPDRQPSVKASEPIKTSDEVKIGQEMSGVIGTFGIGLAVVVVFSGGVFGTVSGVRRVQRNSRKKALKREIFELGVRFQIEKQKYPDWFQSQNMRRIERIMGEMSELTDIALDDILDSGYAKKAYDTNTSLVRNAMNDWVTEYANMNQKLESLGAMFRQKRDKTMTLQADLEREGFQFARVDIPQMPEGANPMETLTMIEQGSGILERSFETLHDIREYYASVKGYDSVFGRNFATKKAEFTELETQYVNIFPKNITFDGVKLEQEARELSEAFRTIYEAKNITELSSLISRSETILASMVSYIQTMRHTLAKYTAIPGEITSRESLLASLNLNRDYRKSASAYVAKTGKTGFLKYDAHGAIGNLQGLLALIKNLHVSKKNLNEVPGKFREFDKAYQVLQEYMGLDRALAEIIQSEMILEQNRRKDKERRDREYEEEQAEQTRRNNAEEERKRQQQRDDDAKRSNDSSPNDTWSSGGGGGYSGGGATSD